jgi:hypothetical protein
LTATLPRPLDLAVDLVRIAMGVVFMLVSIGVAFRRCRP